MTALDELTHQFKAGIYNRASKVELLQLCETLINHANSSQILAQATKKHLEAVQERCALIERERHDQMGRMDN